MNGAVTPTGFIHTGETMRAGDTVIHRPSGETWALAYVKGPYLTWFGWPEGEVCVKACEGLSDEALRQGVVKQACDIISIQVQHFAARCDFEPDPSSQEFRTMDEACALSFWVYQYLHPDKAKFIEAMMAEIKKRPNK